MHYCGYIAGQRYPREHGAAIVDELDPDNVQSGIGHVSRGVFERIEGAPAGAQAVEQTDDAVAFRDCAIGEFNHPGWVESRLKQVFAKRFVAGFVVRGGTHDLPGDHDPVRCGIDGDRRVAVVRPQADHGCSNSARKF